MSPSKLLWLLFQPVQLLSYGLVLGVLAFRHALARRLLRSCALGLALLLLSPLGDWAIRPLETRFPAPVLPASVDGILVLAGAELAAGSARHPDPQFNAYADRLTTALLLARRYPAALLVHAGSGSDPEHPQGAAAWRLFAGAGIAAERLRLVSGSRNTCEDARQARQQLPGVTEQTWLLVTSAFHMPRAIACFRATGWSPLAYPTDYQSGYFLADYSPSRNLANFSLAVHEWLGLAWYRLRGLTQDWYPGP